MKLVLIHGMGRTPLSMLRLRRRLRRAGHEALVFGYSPTVETLQGASGRLARLIETRVGDAPYALIGHSLGTVIIRATLARLDGCMPACPRPASSWRRRWWRAGPRDSLSAFGYTK